MNQRSRNIDTIINELLVLRQRNNNNINYAIDANINFYQSIKSIIKYIKWCIKIAPTLDSTKLLEINDILPKYDDVMHEQLINVERKTIPGIIKPLVRTIIEVISDINHNIVLMSLGSGGAEIEREIIEALIHKNFQKKIVFINVDQSLTAHEIAKKNLASFSSKTDFYFFETLSNQLIEKIKQNSHFNYIVIQCQNDIFKLDDVFPKNYFDIIYNSLFMHHLNFEQREKLENICINISNNFLEYDGYKDFMKIILHSITAWHNIILLNGSVFSGLRYRTKTEILKNIKFNQDTNIKYELKFNNILGHYLLKYSKI